ncbi:hypothetical protein N7471_010695 [Penicillium samsonianum]|uniref:uncharacterized protein n=1 Tax=Penicillium samsonianum TaxID=1882272 RepID=UPI0025493370|nr:uncharacterized protein N7471_010695 [Penicillium samsonianum]KAJ6126202.1 hypothetical protein N7471_010695 [Penicillium samsonianum]
MPRILLPSSAFEPRPSPIVVLSAMIPWMMATLERVSQSQPRRRLDSVSKQSRRLVEILSLNNAIWTLCSVMLAYASGWELRNDGIPLGEGLPNVQRIYIKAYVVYVDMVWRKEVAFKLTPETIDALAELHRELHSVNNAAYALSWRGKQARLDNLKEEFVKAANTFVYLTNAEALAGLKEDGTGELPYDSSEVAKAAILRLCMPSMPSPHISRPVLPLAGGIKPWTPKAAYSSTIVNSWNTQSNVLTPPSHYNPPLENTLNVSHTSFFPAPHPQWTEYPPFHIPRYP